MPPGPGVDDRAVHLPWLRAPQRQLDVVVDGVPMHQRLLAVPAPGTETSWPEEPLVEADLTAAGTFTVDGGRRFRTPAPTGSGC